MPNGDADAQTGGSASDENEGTAASPVRVSAAEIRAVLDTSVLAPPRLRRELQVAAQADLFVGYWSPWIIAELNRVLT